VDTGKLPTGNISSITVSKGVSSVLYGPNTMGGVVNIISRKPERVFESSWDVGYSEDNTWNLNATVGSRWNNLYFIASGGYLDSDGFRLPDKFDRAPNEDGGRRDNSDIDNQWSSSAKVGCMPFEGHEYAFGINWVDSEWGLPPNVSTSKPRFWRFAEWEKTTYYFIGDTRITDELMLKTRLFRDEYYNVLDSYDDNTYSSQTMKSAFHSTYDDYTNGVSATLRTEYIKKNTISFAFNFKEDVHRAQGDYGEAWERYEAETFSYALEDDIKLTKRLAFVVGASYDVQHPKYANGASVRDDEDSFNPQGGASVLLFEDTLVHFSVGKKTRYPSLKELYSELLGKNIANPNLKEESSVNYEVGVEQPLPWCSNVKINIFYYDVTDMIVNKQVAPSTSQYQNIGDAVLKGVELSLSSKAVANNDFEINYTYLEAEDKSADRTCDHLPDTPKSKLYITDLYTLNRWVSFFVKAEFNSKRWQQDLDSTEWTTFHGFSTVDAKVIGHITPNISLEVGARNIFDDNYVLSLGFPREGRTFFTVLRGTFGS